MKNHSVDIRYFLPVEVEPYIDESGRGLLMRIAERNHLSHPKRILEMLRPQGPTNLLEKDLLPLSEACACDPGLLGILAIRMSRDSRGIRTFQLGNQRVSKDYFLTGKTARICPECLGEFCYARQAWDLTLSNACPIHEVLLEDRCPACLHNIAGLRSSLLHCQCGFPLTRIVTQEATEFEIFVAGLLQRFFSDLKPVSIHLPGLIADRLSDLSLDGLCKLLWYLGVYLPSRGSRPAGQSRHRYTVFETRRIIEAAYSYLVAWPNLYLKTLRALVGHSSLGKANSLMEQWFGSIHSYLINDMDDSGLGFVRTAFEFEIRNIWKAIHHSKLPAMVSAQMEFDFTECM